MLSKVKGPCTCLVGETHKRNIKTGNLQILIKEQLNLTLGEEKQSNN